VSATPDLATLERWMQAVVMHDGGALAGVKARPARALIAAAARDLEQVVLPSKQLSAAERLDIYAHMYYARLVEVMEGEYPTTQRILGAEEFARLCRRFVAKNPSRTRTLNALSAGFPDFLARSLPKTHRAGLAVDVARIERAMEDVFDAPRAEPMGAAQFAAAGSDPTGRAVLRVTPALRLLALRYPANAYMNAVRRGEKPRIPRPRATSVIVFRRGFSVFRRDQDPAQWKLLAALVAGKPLAAAVRGALRGRSGAGAARGAAARAAKELGGWFEEWSAAQLFVAPRKGDAPL
jgi:hypothetical protein